MELRDTIVENGMSSRVISRWKWGDNLMDFVRACRERNNFIWIMIGRLVSELDETLEVDEKLSAKCYL